MGEMSNGNGKHANGSPMDESSRDSADDGDSSVMGRSFKNEDNEDGEASRNGDSGNQSSSDDDIPLTERARLLETSRTDLGVKMEVKGDSDSEDDIPLAKRAAALAPRRSSNGKVKKPKREMKEESDSEEDYKPVKKSSKRESHSHSKKHIKDEKKSPRASTSATAQKRAAKAAEEEAAVWKWWEEEKRDDGVKWKSLEHAGPLFAPPYEPLPSSVKFRYDGATLRLSAPAEEVMGFYARMIDHDYTKKETFNNNFMRDWRKVMSSEERAKIVDLKKCDFREVDAFYKEKSEQNKNRSKEEKLRIKEQKDKEVEQYGFAFMDGYKQKIGNFRIEPPGLFRGRGDHPKMGKLKRRTMPEDVTLNCSKGSKVPKAPSGHSWKEVRHDNTVTWLCSWTENIANQNKYVMLNPSSKIKGQKDYEKYERARELKGCVEEIRRVYMEDFKSKEMRVRQRAVALYFIDKLALRAGNEKDAEEAADTVGCCSLRVEHVTLTELEEDGETVYQCKFDFLGKDSIQYVNVVPVEKRVFKNLKRFVDGKKGEDDLFDRVDTSSLNQHLQTLMPGLTAKVFRTFNASFTLQQQLNKAMKDTKKMSLPEKVLAYNRANREVAILCNHQRAAPKTFDKSMETLNEKIDKKRAEVKAAKKEAEAARKGEAAEKARRKYDRLKEQLDKMKLARTDKEENKEIALGTSKLNYLDPRISVAWCKKYDVPLEKVYSKTHREKFRWAIDMIMGQDDEFQF